MTKKPIRVGIIRCDLHAFYYGALMFKHDPLKLREKSQSAFFYFYLQYNDPRAMTVPFIGGFELARVWDADYTQAQAMVEVFGSKGAVVCESFEEVSDGVDLVFIAECNGDGSDHLKLATPSLKKGVPTYVDKPLAFNLKDAQAIVKLARQRRNCTMSLSMLREVPQAAQFRNRFNEIGVPEFGIIKTADYHTMAAHIHAISLAQHLFGSGVESVECMGQTPLAYVHLDYGKQPDKPRRGVILNCASGTTWHCALYASVYSKQGAIYSPPIGDFEFPYGAGIILKKIQNMVRTGRTQAPYEEMLENIAVADVARLAQKRGRAVKLLEVWKR